MVLPQSEVTDFADAPWEALPSGGMSELGGVGGRLKEQEEGREWKLILVCKMRKNIKTKFKKYNLLPGMLPQVQHSGGRGGGWLGSGPAWSTD